MKNHWMNELDERQQKELMFARMYAKDFAHGTDGHHRLLLIAKLAAMLDEAVFGPQPDEPTKE
jgi:hypothetical protein